VLCGGHIYVVLGMSTSEHDQRPSSVSSFSRWIRAQNLHAIIPILMLIVCVSGVILVLGLISGGVLAGLAVLIPCVVLGGLSSVSLITSIIVSNCVNAQDEIEEASAAGAVPDRSRFRRMVAQPSRSTVRRRLEFFGQMVHVVDPGDEDQRTCSICLCEDPPNRIVLNCGHMFHEDCVKEWMTRARLARCPLCRSGLAASVPHGGLTQPQGDNRPLPIEECPTSPNSLSRYIV